MLRWILLLFIIAGIIACGESEQPLSENQELEVNDIASIKPSGIKVTVNDRIRDHEEVPERLMQSYVERGLRDLEYKLVEQSARFIVNIKFLELMSDTGHKTGDVAISCVLLERHMDQECYIDNWAIAGGRSNLREIGELIVVIIDETIKKKNPTSVIAE